MLCERSEYRINCGPSSVHLRRTEMQHLQPGSGAFVDALGRLAAPANLSASPLPERKQLQSRTSSDGWAAPVTVLACKKAMRHLDSNG